jgi:hypothetical protein
MFRISVSVAVALMLPACTGSGTSTPTLPVEQIAGDAASVVVKAASPDACGRRVHFVARPRGGSFQVPHCGGWSGTINFPSTPIRSVWDAVSSVTNNFGAPPPPSGTPLFYMQMQLHHPGGAAFHNDGTNDTVTSSQFSPQHTYALNVYYFAYNDQCPSTQCTWSLDIGAPQPGSHSITFNSPLNGASIFGGSDGAIVWQFTET